MVYRRSKKFLLIGCLIIILFLSFQIWKIKTEKIVSFFYKSSESTMSNSLKMEQKSETAIQLSPSFSHIYSCPICFGYGMCNEVMKGSILFHGELTLAPNMKILWKKGVLQTRRVLISSLPSEEWNKLDESLCRNASQAVPCDLSSVIWKTVFAQEDLLSIQKFRNLNSLLDLPLTQLALPVCSSIKLLNELIKTFDENFDGLFNKEERILLLTSLVMHPGYVILKLQAKTRMTMPMPNLLGACGRSIILEGGLKPLKTFLAESFDTRAGLAVQVLQLVEDFENKHEFSCLLPVIRRRSSVVFPLFGIYT